MKRYKLLNPDRTTHNGMHWPIGEWQEATGDPSKGLCSDGWLHCYDSPELALFMNPIHANIHNPIVAEVETQGRSLNDKGLKRGYRKMRVVRYFSIPLPTREQLIKFAVLCARCVYSEPSWVQWADGWLLGEDRTACATARATNDAAECALVDAAAHTAHTAAYAAHTAAYDDADYMATYAVVCAARAAHASGNKLDLVMLAKEAMS